MRNYILLLAVLAASTLHAQDADRSVKGGGITVSGWKGRVDRRPAAAGKTVNDSKLASEGGALRLSVGPAAIYWNDANTASGDYFTSNQNIDLVIIPDLFLSVAKSLATSADAFKTTY